MMSLAKCFPSDYRMLYDFLLEFQLLAKFLGKTISKAAIFVSFTISRDCSWKEIAPPAPPPPPQPPTLPKKAKIVGSEGVKKTIRLCYNT